MSIKNEYHIRKSWTYSYCRQGMIKYETKFNKKNNNAKLQLGFTMLKTWAFLISLIESSEYFSKYIEVNMWSNTDILTENYKTQSK